MENALYSLLYLYPKDFGIKEKSIMLTHTMCIIGYCYKYLCYLWLVLWSRVTVIIKIHFNLKIESGSACMQNINSSYFRVKLFRIHIKKKLYIYIYVCMYVQTNNSHDSSHVGVPSEPGQSLVAPQNRCVNCVNGQWLPSQLIPFCFSWTGL